MIIFIIIAEMKPKQNEIKIEDEREDKNIWTVYI